LKNDSIKPDYITFSGNGEATLHPEFSTLVEKVIALRDELSPTARTAILSNGTQLILPEIRSAIDKLDVKIIKLDSANHQVYARYNRPLFPVNTGQLVETLMAIKNLTVQALFCRGPAGNFSQSHLYAWINTIQKIRPVMVQIYSLDRGYQSKKIIKLNKSDLQPLAESLILCGIPAQVF